MRVQTGCRVNIWYNEKLLWCLSYVQIPRGNKAHEFLFPLRYTVCAAAVESHTTFLCQSKVWSVFFFLSFSQHICKIHHAWFCSDILSKEKFHLKQNVEPFIHYEEKHSTFECITRQNIEAVAAKVCSWLECASLLSPPPPPKHWRTVMGLEVC